jgi:tetratricopeptide (TPR) repeat protein
MRLTHDAATRSAGIMKRSVRRIALLASLAFGVAGLALEVAAADDRDTCSQASGEPAIAACSRLIESGNIKGNDLAMIYHDRGVEWGNKQQYDRAITDFDQAIELNPGLALAFKNRGGIYVRKGQYDRAIEDFDHAIRLDPNSADAFNDRGQTYKRMNQLDRAIEDFDKAIQLNPDFGQAYFTRGQLKLHLGDRAGGNADMAKGRELDPHVN